jgi:hypothetical protein
MTICTDGFEFLVGIIEDKEQDQTKTNNSCLSFPLRFFKDDKYKEIIGTIKKSFFKRNYHLNIID